MIVIKTREDAEKYYDVNRNTYRFAKGDNTCSVVFECKFMVKSHIEAKNIFGRIIKCLNINARNISADDVTCDDIDAGTIQVRKLCCNDIKAYEIEAADLWVNDITVSDDISAEHIRCCDMRTRNLMAYKIEATDILAYGTIEVTHIRFVGCCYAYDDIIYDTIQGAEPKSQYFSLRGKVQRRFVE